jgi:hypothetical protein
VLEKRGRRRRWTGPLCASTARAHWPAIRAEQELGTREDDIEERKVAPKNQWVREDRVGGRRHALVGARVQTRAERSTK